MGRFLLRSFLCGVVIALSSLSARACINDREVNNAEREFKSQYQEKPVSEPPASAPAPSLTTDPLKEYGPLALGGMLLVGALVQVRRRSKA